MADHSAAVLGEDGPRHVGNPRGLPRTCAIPVHHTQGTSNLGRHRSPRQTAAATQHEYPTFSCSCVLISDVLPQDLRDPLEEITDLQEQEAKKEKALQSNADRSENTWNTHWK